MANNYYDYFSYKIIMQKAELEKIALSEEGISDRERRRSESLNKQERRELNDEIKQFKNQIGEIIQDFLNRQNDFCPTKVNTYFYMQAAKMASGSTYLETWQEQEPSLPSYFASIYQKYWRKPEVDLELFPVGSFVIQFKFRLAEPYFSRDENDFYFIDNPIRRDKLLQLPVIAATGWKGNFSSALHHIEHERSNPVVQRLLGNDKKEKQAFHAGRLHFYPTFFEKTGLEVINPHDRQSNAGTIPIFFETVPPGTPGYFTLVYIPIYNQPSAHLPVSAKHSLLEVSEDLKMTTAGLCAMFRKYGFSAKKTSGFGLADEKIEEASIKLKKPAQSKVEPPEINSFAGLEKAGQVLAQQLKEAADEL